MKGLRKCIMILRQPKDPLEASEPEFFLRLLSIAKETKIQQS